MVLDPSSGPLSLCSLNRPQFIIIVYYIFSLSVTEQCSRWRYWSLVTTFTLHTTGNFEWQVQQSMFCDEKSRYLFLNNILWLQWSLADNMAVIFLQRKNVLLKRWFHLNYLVGLNYNKVSIKNCDLIIKFYAGRYLGHFEMTKLLTNPCEKVSFRKLRERMRRMNGNSLLKK